MRHPTIRATDYRTSDGSRSLFRHPNTDREMTIQIGRPTLPMLTERAFRNPDGSDSEVIADLLTRDRGSAATPVPPPRRRARLLPAALLPRAAASVTVLVTLAAAGLTPGA